MRRNQIIQQRRRELGMTQSQLAEEAELSLRTIQIVEKGRSSVRPETIHRIGDALGLTDDQLRDDTSKDAFDSWPWSLSKFIQGDPTLSEHAHCRGLEDARAAVRKMRASWGEHLKRSESPADGDGFAIADQKLDDEYPRYEQRYLEIWKTNPNCILYSTAGTQRCGVTIVLPVTDRAYDELRQGKCTFMDVEASDVLPESQNLILDSAVELHGSHAQPWYGVTDSVSFTLFFQMALLSIDPTADGFRMLGFAASPINLKRLCGTGFSPCGVHMPEYGYEICEFSTGVGGQSNETYKRSATATHYVNLFKQFLPKNRLRVPSQAMTGKT
nr:helix-turn-helix transcriptional regulator [Rhodopirellula sp. JC639]